MFTSAGLRWRLKALGSFGLWVGDAQIPEPATRKARAVLVYLALNAGTPVAREKLLDLLWPEADPERARASLSTALWSIRKLLRGAGVDGGEFIDSNNTAITWSSHGEVDAVEFSRLARSGDAGAREAAIALYAGDFLTDDYDDWAIAERERLAADYERLLAATLSASSDAELAHRLLERDPYNEDAYVALIEAQLEAKRPFAALGLVERYHRALRDLGAVPSDGFTRRYAHIETLVRPAPRDFSLPLMGRDDEFGTLCERVARLRRGEGSLILLHGDPGIGKSTLLQQLVKVATGVPTFTLAAIDGDPRPYGPWERFFTERTGDNFHDVVKSTRNVAETIAVRLSVALSEPAAIIVDDAQYLRAEAFEILVRFAALAQQRHCVIIASRPERTADIRTALHAAPLIDIGLQLISESDFTAGVSAATNESDLRFIDAMYRRSRGHPLFFTEICKALVRDGTLVLEDRVWRYAGSESSLGGIPDTLRATIQSRLRARGEDAAQVATVLALDPDASLRDITGVVQLTDERAVDALDELLSARIIEESNAGPHYRFTHDLIGEVAAELLTRPRRQALHRLLVAYLRDVRAAYAPARLAHHLAACGEHFEAAQSYVAAAQEAVEWNAWRQAVAYCEHAIEHVAALPKDKLVSQLAAEIRCLMAQAQCDGLAFGQAVATASRAIEDAKRSDDRTLLATALLRRAFAHTSLGDIDALSDASAAAELIAPDVQPALYLRTNEVRLPILFGAWQFDAAVKLSRESLAVALRHERITSASRALHYIVTIEGTRWRFAEAVTAARESAHLARRGGHAMQGSDAFAVARLAYLLDDCTTANLLVDRGFECLRALRARPDPGDLVEIPPSLLSLFLLYMRALIANRTGDYERAIDSAGQALRDTNGSANVLCLVMVDALLGQDSAGALDAAAAQLAALPHDYVPNALGFSDTRKTCEARIETRRGSASAPALLAGALDEVAERAKAAPLTADAVFSQLRACAEALGDAALISRASSLEKNYADRHRARAGPLWRSAASLLAN